MSFRWYVVNVYSGFEHKVAEIIREQSKKKDLDKYFEDILIPTQEVVEVKKGEKVTSEKQYFPGYVLVRMELIDETWHLVKDIPKVTGFLGAQNKPTPVSAKEVKRIMQQVEEGVSSPTHMVQFEVGEEIRVCDGPFTSFNGIVEDVDSEKSRLKVSVSIFGRSTPVDLDFTQVEKV